MRFSSRTYAILIVVGENINANGTDPDNVSCPAAGVITTDTAGSIDRDGAVVLSSKLPWAGKRKCPSVAKLVGAKVLSVKFPCVGNLKWLSVHCTVRATVERVRLP